MKADLGVNDAQIGWLYGVFAVFYAIAALPIAWLADRRSRKFIIAAGIFFWSLMTMACGLSRSFWHVLLARIGVGVGEATLSPAATSLVGDFFPWCWPATPSCSGRCPTSCGCMATRRRRLR